MPFDAIDSIARKHYHLQTGVWPDSSYSYTNEDKDGLFIVLSDAEGNPLAVYTIDVKTGIGTDAEGNDVDLSVYADYELLTEEDYFISPELFDDAGQGYFTEQTGIQPYMTYYYVDDIIPVAEITFFDEDDNLLERYMIDPATGIGTDNSGNLVDLAEYADTHEISDEYPRSEIDETGFFAPVDVILEYVKKEYIEKTGIVPNGFSFMITPNSDNAEIEVLGNDGILDVYWIDVRTGIGTNQDGDMIDLTAYAEKMNDPEEPVNLDESDYFAPSDDFSVLARADYIKKNQTMPELALTMIALDTLESEIQIYNAEFDIVDRYMIDVKTGSGKNSEETPVDLSVYARETDESGFFASMDEMCQMAKTDFMLKTGAECETAEAVWDSTDNTVVIMLTDAEGAPLDYCIIDPLTGVGSSAYGHEVNLPQTGNNAAGSLMAAVGALLMIGAGAVAFKSSGVVRRKED